MLMTQLGPAAREITDTRARTQADLGELYQRMVDYVLLSSGVGSLGDVNTVREATGNVPLRDVMYCLLSSQGCGLRFP